MMQNSLIQLIDRKYPGFNILPNNKVFWRTTALLMYHRCPLYFDLYFKKNTNRNLYTDRHLVNGLIVHRGVEFLIKMYLFGLNEDNKMLIDVIENTIRDIKQLYNSPDEVNIFKDPLEYAYLAKLAFKEILANFDVVDSEIIHIFEHDNFILKITPDIIAKNTVIDVKTTSKPLAKYIISHDYQLQGSIYTEFLNLNEVVLVVISFHDTKVQTIKLNRTNNVLDLVREYTINVLNKKFPPKRNQYCYACKFKNECPLYSERTEYF